MLFALLINLPENAQKLTDNVEKCRCIFLKNIKQLCVSVFETQKQCNGSKSAEVSVIIIDMHLVLSTFHVENKYDISTGMHGNSGGQSNNHAI